MICEDCKVANYECSCKDPPVLMCEHFANKHSTFHSVQASASSKLKSLLLKFKDTYEAQTKLVTYQAECLVDYILYSSYQVVCELRNQKKQCEDFLECLSDSRVAQEFLHENFGVYTDTSANLKKHLETLLSAPSCFFPRTFSFSQEQEQSFSAFLNSQKSETIENFSRKVSFEEPKTFPQEFKTPKQCCKCNLVYSETTTMQCGHSYCFECQKAKQTKGCEFCKVTCCKCTEAYVEYEEVITGSLLCSNCFDEKPTSENFNCFFCESRIATYELLCKHIICTECYNQQKPQKNWCFLCLESKKNNKHRLASTLNLSRCKNCSSFCLEKKIDSLYCTTCGSKFCAYCGENSKLGLFHEFKCSAQTKDSVKFSGYISLKNSNREYCYCPNCGNIKRFQPTDPVNVRCLSSKCKGRTRFCRMCSRKLKSMSEFHIHSVK